MDPCAYEQIADSAEGYATQRHCERGVEMVKERIDFGSDSGIRREERAAN